ncbi:MAG: hypothetical protein ACJAW3_000917 [Lentimonas sp.]
MVTTGGSYLLANMDPNAIKTSEDNYFAGNNVSFSGSVQNVFMSSADTASANL